MQTPQNDTISAIITPPGVGGIAVIRMSGPRAVAIADAIFRGTVALADASAQSVHFGRILDAAGGDLDEVLATVFRAPHSYTAEDVVEISCHGSPYIARRVLELTIAGGARPAGPGEFTRRAFLNGRIDLSQAEAVADLIAADSRSSHDLAIAQLRGMLSGKITTLRTKILDICSMLELELDFSEEGVQFLKREELKNALGAIEREITQLIDSYELGKIVREGLRVVLVGAPNVGKSSILNSLMRENRAIVTPVSGTTRDTLEESITIDGSKFMIVDTAGLRSTADPVEVEGIRRTREQIEHADMVLIVIDPTQDIPSQQELHHRWNYTADGEADRRTLVINKVDLADPQSMEIIRNSFPGLRAVSTIATTGFGIQELEWSIAKGVASSRGRTPGEGLIASNARQKQDLQLALEHLLAARVGVEGESSPELLAVDLRACLGTLSRVVGEDISEEVLNNVFSRFCIGK